MAIREDRPDAGGGAPSDNLAGSLDRLYAARFPEAERAEKAELWKTLCASFFSRYSSADACVLDLGAGYCDFINNIPARRKIAVDVNPDTARFANRDVTVIAEPLRRIADVVEQSTVDLAFASNVFEHLRDPDELLHVLRSVRHVLAPSGRLVILQPNVRLLGGRFWDFFDHTLPLTEKGMAEALTVAGFRVVECRARFLPYTTKSVLPQWSILVRAYLALRIAQWLMGKQMLIVAERAP